MCADNDKVMVSYETFEERLRMPKAYFCFYEYLYRSAMGDKLWNEALEPKATGRIGCPSTEAFTHLLLRNNWKAWILSNKQKKDMGARLKTMYDAGANAEEETIFDYLLPDVEFGDFLDDDTKEADKYIIRRKENSARNDALVAASNLRLKAFATLVEASRGDLELKKAMQGMEEIEESSGQGGGTQKEETQAD